MRLSLTALALACLAGPIEARAQATVVPPLSFPDTAMAREILVAVARWLGDSASGIGPAQFVLPSDSLLRGCRNDPECSEFPPFVMKSLAREFGRALPSSPLGERMLVVPFLPKLASPTEVATQIHRGRAVCGPRGTVGLGAYALRLRRGTDGRWQVFHVRPTAAVDAGCTILPQTRLFDSITYRAEHRVRPRPGGRPIRRQSPTTVSFAAFS